MKTPLKIALGGLVGAGLVYGATRVFETPFADEQEELIRHATRTDLRIKWNPDGQPESMVVIDQGLTETDAKYYDLVPLIAPNPEEASGVFQFDHEIEQWVQMGGREGNLTYKVNSADNSMYFSGYDLEQSSLSGEGIRRLRQAGYQVDFAIRNAAREMLLYATHQREGKVCISVPLDLGASQVLAEDYLYQMEFLSSVKETEQMGGMADPKASLQPMQGRVTLPDGSFEYIDMWFGREEAQVGTSVPIMGLGVGIFKDFLEKKQKLLVMTRGGGAWLKLLHLEGIEPWGINTEAYRIIDFNIHTRAGMDQAEDLMAWFKAKREEIDLLRKQRKECPPHQAGSACRRDFEERIRAIEQELAERAADFSRAHLPPVE